MATDEKIVQAACANNVSIEQMTPAQMRATLRELAFWRINEAGPVSAVWDEVGDDSTMRWMFTLVGGLKAALAREGAIYGR